MSNGDLPAELVQAVRNIDSLGGPVARHLVRLLICVSLTLAGAAGPLVAQSGTLHGTVADSGGGTLPNATVTVEGTGLRTVTGSTGEYQITGVSPGPHTVHVRLIGYRAASAAVTVRATEVTRLDFA